MFWAEEIGYLFNIAMIKVSIMLLFARIFQTPRWRLITQCAIVIFWLKIVAFLFPLVFQCRPMRAIWDPNVHGACLDISAIGFAGAGLSISEDLILFVIPIPTLWRLQLDRSKKLLLVALFSIGSL